MAPVLKITRDLFFIIIAVAINATYRDNLSILEALDFTPPDLWSTLTPLRHNIFCGHLDGGAASQALVCTLACFMVIFYFGVVPAILIAHLIALAALPLQRQRHRQSHRSPRERTPLPKRRKRHKRRSTPPSPAPLFDTGLVLLSLSLRALRALIRLTLCFDIHPHPGPTVTWESKPDLTDKEQLLKLLAAKSSAPLGSQYWTQTTPPHPTQASYKKELYTIYTTLRTTFGVAKDTLDGIIDVNALKVARRPPRRPPARRR